MYVLLSSKMITFCLNFLNFATYPFSLFFFRSNGIVIINKLAENHKINACSRSNILYNFKKLFEFCITAYMVITKKFKIDRLGTFKVLVDFHYETYV